MDWFKKKMIGRYGLDNLSNFMVLAVVVIRLILVWGFKLTKHMELINAISFLTIGFAYFRIFSKNINKRYRENQKYLALKNRLKNIVPNLKKKKEDRRNYKYFKCTNCKQKIRLPRGKGKLVVTCPKCKEKMNKRT